MTYLDFSKGLLPAVVQDHKTGEVLMLAYMNEEAWKMTLKTHIAHYYSRSRRSLWKKGETSGHTQKVKEIYIDCDGDTILLKVEQRGAACHMGYRSCFYRKLEDNNLKVVGERVFDPKKVYNRGETLVKK